MLSIGAMGAGQGDYYLSLAREDYYLDGGEPPGQWHGKGAVRLGLTGVVQATELNRLFEGYHPETGRPLLQNAGKADHQPGWDLTFSAPKSVSVLWSQASPGTRRALEAAQEAAVQAGIDYLEASAAVTRRGRGGAEREPAHLVVATFEHGTSRAQDPQLHTHALVLNVCTRADGSTGTIQSRPLYESKMAAGAVYRAELAHQLEQRLGVTIERRGRLFEIAGVSESLTQEFSKRRAEIQDALREKGYDSAAAAAAATLSTREVKGHVSRAELFQDWRRTGIAHQWSRNEAEDLRGPAPQRNLRLEAAAALGTATGTVTEQQSWFSERTFVRHLAEECPGRGLGARALQAAAQERLAQSGEIVSLGRRNGERVFTTREMLALEERLLGAVDRSREQTVPGVPQQTIGGVLASRKAFSAEQEAALRHVVEPGARIRVVSGMAGTGKTTFLAAARMAWELEGFQVYGASLGGKAAAGLARETRIQSETLHRTLLDLEAGRRQLSSRSVLVLDEAGMVGTRLMNQLVESTERSGARLVLVGDAKQLQPIEAGGPFAEIERRLGATELTEIRRQRDEWARQAVRDFAAGDAGKGLHAYAERGLLTIADDPRAAQRALIEAWKTQGVRAPEEQLIFAGTRSDATLLNRMAQAERAHAGALGAEQVRGEHGDLFHAGDRVLFTRKSRLHGVENGSLGEVAAVNAATRSLAVRLDGGERVRISLDEYPHVRLGYAMTTHKGQGATVERAFVLAGGSMQDREISYVQASRARGETQIFTDRLEAGERLTQLVREMSRSRQKELAHVVQGRAQSEPQQPDHTLSF